MLALVVVANFAMAGDIVVKTPIDDVIVKIDKNGDEYVRIIINEEHKMQGVQYTVGVPVMVFGGDLVATAKGLQAGDMLNAVCIERKYQDSRSLVLRAFLQ